MREPQIADDQLEKLGVARRVRVPLVPAFVDGLLEGPADHLGRHEVIGVLGEPGDLPAVRVRVPEGVERGSGHERTNVNVRA